MENNCPVCGVKPNQKHEPGCDIERCPECGRQLISCNCVYEFFGISDVNMDSEWSYVYYKGLTDKMEKLYYDDYLESKRMEWSGEYPGLDAIREYNLESLNDIYTKLVWSKEQQKFILRV